MVAGSLIAGAAVIGVRAVIEQVRCIFELLFVQGLRERISQMAEIEVGGLGHGSDQERQNIQATAAKGGEQST